MATRGRPRKHANDFDYTVRSDWYLSRGWLGARAVALDRAGHRCARCSEPGPRLTGHHLVDPFPTRSVELLLDQANIEVICEPCHMREHNDTNTTIICEVCSAVVKCVPSKAKTKRFCSLTCRDKHPDFAALEPRTCTECPIVFQPKNSKALRCSDRCARLAAARTRREREP